MNISLWSDWPPSFNGSESPEWTLPQPARGIIVAEYLPTICDPWELEEWAEGQHIRFIVAPELDALVGACRVRGLVAIHPEVAAAGREVAHIFLRTAYERLNHPHLSPDLLVALFHNAGPRVPQLIDFLTKAPLTDRITERALVDARDGMLTEALLGPTDSRRARRAFGLIAKQGDLTLIPRLQATYHRASCDASRRRIVLALRSTAEVNCRVNRDAGRPTIRRRTHEGRLAEVDRHVCNLLVAARSMSLDTYRGVDLARWSRAIEGVRPVIVDHGVADGTTAFDLTTCLATAFPGSNPTASVIGTDLALHLHIVDDGLLRGVFDHDHELLQVRLGWELFDRADWDADPEFLADERRTLSAGLDTAVTVRLVNPAATAAEAADPRRLRFLSHDLHQPFPVPVHIARVFGLLYAGVRPNSDSPAYFEAEEIV